jgi:pimeloyl-ACP methyl ester carboxylesterase
MDTKKKKILTISIISAVSFLLVCMIVLYCVAVSIYDGSFHYRCTTSEEATFTIEQFPSMKRERHTFTSNKKQTLVGYLYENADESVEEKGVVVFAHGLGGGGQRGYMDIFEIMTQNGYYVFAYDATANDESEGEVVGGLPQGFIDLDYAISYAQTMEKTQDLPFVLMGYSWGGLSVGNVLNYHPEVKAVASLAGWNKSMDLIDYRGCQMVGGVAKMLLPFASVYEFFQYGKYAFSTSMKGFANSDCGVMIVHSADDTTIPIGYGYDTYYKKYKDNPRFVFKKYEDRDHGVLTGADGKLDTALVGEVVAFFDSYVA